MAVASAEPYASYLHFAPEDNDASNLHITPEDNHASTLSDIFTGWMPFLTPNQQRQGYMQQGPLG